MFELDDVTELLDGNPFATVATLNPDGSPQTSVVWVMRDGDAIAFSTTERRQKARNVTRDPRVSMTIYDTANPYRTVEVRGRAQVTPDEGNVFQRAVNRKYLDDDPPPDPAGTVRVVVRVVPEKVTVFSP